MIARKYQLKSNRDWKLTQKRKKLADVDYTKAIIPILYRSFDQRAYIHHGDLIDRSRHKGDAPYGGGDNLGLITVKQFKVGNKWYHSFVANMIIESTYISNKTSEISYLFPLYLDLPKAGKKVTKAATTTFATMGGATGRSENFAY